MPSSPVTSVSLALSRWSPILLLLLALLVPQRTAGATPRVLRVGVEALNEPFSYVNPDGRPAGYTVDLLQAVARQQHLELELVVLDWPGVLAAFRAGRLDLLCNVADTPERRAYMDFSTTTIVLQGGLYQRQGAPPLRTAADLAGRRLAVPQAARAYQFVRDQQFPVTVLPYPTVEACLRAVRDGEADLTMATTLTIRYLLRRHGFSNIVPTELQWPEFTYRMHFGVQKGETDLLASLNEGLFALSRDGTYDTLQEQWVGPLQPRRLRWIDVQNVVFLFSLILVLGLVVLFWQRRVLREEQHQAEALRRSQEQLQLVIESTQDGFWDYDVPSGRVVRSPRWAEMLGYAPEDIPATPEGFIQLLHPDDRRKYNYGREVPHQGSDYFQHEMRLRCRKGDWKWLLVRGKIVVREPGSGRVLRLAGTHTDITERKTAETESARLQARMLETQKLESLGILAGGIAHDFNNLLTIIMAGTTLVRLDPRLQREHAQQLEKTLLAADRAAYLCRQLLAYAGRGAYLHERIDFNRLVRETTSLLETSLGQAHVEYSLAPEQPCVMGDPSQMGQIVMNLVLNAAEALGDYSGTIGIATNLVTLPKEGLPAALPAGSLTPGTFLCLEVSDSGAGIPPEQIERIFDPFYSTKFAGRGLGLAAVLGIVRTHRGGLTVRSTPGVGSVFRVYLPPAPPAELKHPSLAPVADPVAALPSPPADPTAPQHVLFADDELYVRELTIQLLIKLGYAPTAAGDGLDAVRRFADAPDRYAVVLLDITMPRLDGLGALKQIHLLRPQVPVILISGHSLLDTRRQLQGDPQTYFLEKPFTADGLRVTLRRALGETDSG